MIYEFALGRQCAAPFPHERIHASMHTLRHFLYRETAGWDVPEHGGFEYDEFDTPAARYLVGIDEAGTVRAQSRLITCEKHYMLADLWPSLAKVRALPRTPRDAEGSRTAVDVRLPEPERRRWWGMLLIAHIEWAVANDVETISFVTYPGMVEKSLVPSGLDVTIYGDTMQFPDGEFLAGWFKCSPEHVRFLRDLHRIDGNVLAFLPEQQVAVAAA